ncbi:uncharacterized protein LOC143909074 [Arctopsyche grandis]|uniref:uncharacterized protein LOC143909074 n=1 Tax=Arctopsyche grandis TaxID=121162 RepID=UPI00406D9A1E
MKVLVVLAIFGVGAVLGTPEAPAGPYAPRGWRPNGPAFELPTETGNQDSIQQYEAPEENAELEVTEEEIQYTGEIGTTEATTPFLEYGAPATEVPEEEDPTPAPFDDDLSVQGLPGSEAAQEFRAFPSFAPSQRFTNRKNQQQRFTAQAVQFARVEPRPAKFRQQQVPQFQRQRVATFSNNFQPNPRQQFGSKLQAFSGPTANGGFTRGFNQQFGRLTAPAAPTRTQRTRPVVPSFQRFTSQKQVALDSYGAPTQEYGPPAQPAQEYGPPPQDELEEPPQETSEPEFTPEEVNEETTEVNDAEDEASPNIAISNAVANAKYRSQRRQAKSARLQQFKEPIFTYDQSGRLVRIF